MADEDNGRAACEVNSSPGAANCRLSPCLGVGRGRRRPTHRSLPWVRAARAVLIAGRVRRAVSRRGPRTNRRRPLSRPHLDRPRGRPRLVQPAAGPASWQPVGLGCRSSQPARFGSAPPLPPPRPCPERSCAGRPRGAALAAHSARGRRLTSPVAGGGEGAAGRPPQVSEPGDGRAITGRTAVRTVRPAHRSADEK